MPVKSISKGGKADLLRTVSKKLERRRLHTGWVERILHARVPILKFKIQGEPAQPAVSWPETSVLPYPTSPHAIAACGPACL